MPPFSPILHPSPLRPLAQPKAPTSKREKNLIACLPRTPQRGKKKKRRRKKDPVRGHHACELEGSGPGREPCVPNGVPLLVCPYAHLLQMPPVSLAHGAVVSM